MIRKFIKLFYYIPVSKECVLKTVGGMNYLIKSVPHYPQSQHLLTHTRGVDRKK